MSGAEHPLDNPAYASLTGPHASLAESFGTARRYPPDMSPFAALPSGATDADWADLAVLAGQGAVVALVNPEPAPDGWESVFRMPGVQMVAEQVAGTVDPAAVRLTAEDVPDMLALIERTKPGPFLTRTVEMGAYLGVRRDGELVAMAGERMHPPGATEVSAVCTDPAHRGEGLAARLVASIVNGIQERGETAFLHATAVNTPAIRLYEAMGFRLRRTVSFEGFRAP